MLAAALVAGCGSAKASDTATPSVSPPIVVAATPAESATGLYIAYDEGLFRKAGLKVTIKDTPSVSSALPLLLHNQVQVIGGQFASFVSAQAAGAGSFKILAPGNSLGPRVEEIVVPAGSPITSVPDLEGKTIAVNSLDSIAQWLSEVILAAYHIPASRVHFVPVSFPDMGAALAAHRVDAAYLIEPYLTQSEEQYGAVALADADAGPAQNLPISAYMATSAWAKKYPRAAAAFARAIGQANEIATTNLGEFQEAMERHVGISPKVADIMASGTYPLSVDATQFQRVADIMFEYGALKKPISVKGMILN
jgi:NitT/TauT family transport system substrate-binding protein